MGFLNRLKLATNVATKNWRSGGWDGVNLPVWAPDHPLNQAAVYAGQGLLADRERIENDFMGYVYGAYKANGPVFSCITARQMVFSEAQFQFKAKQDGKLFGNSDLSILETPWPGGTTGELLGRMEQDVSLAGNSYWTRCDDNGNYGNAARGGPGERLAHLRPDWVTIIIGSHSGDPRDIDARPLGIIYQPYANGIGLSSNLSGNYDEEGVLLTMEEVAHYSPVPDPIARFRGMSWLTPILREIESDKSATKHKANFYDNAAVPNMAIKFDKDTNEDDFNDFVANFRSGHQGSWNAYKTLFLMGGADVTPLTHDFRQLDFSNVVGKGESRIASAAGVPPSWVGFSEGLQGSALNAGNLAANRRRFADGTIRPLWRIAVASLAPLVNVPSGSVLWWSEAEIAFLREDQTDRSNIMHIDMNAVDAGIKAGFEPDAVVDAVEAKDLRLLTGKHTGLVSVQMQPPTDPANHLEEDQGTARIMQTLALTIQTFVTAGFTHKSAVAAAEANDLTLLVKDTAMEPWSPTGTALRVPGAGADNGTPTPVPAGTGASPGASPPGASPTGQATKPPAAKPPTTPGGGSNGQ